MPFGIASIEFRKEHFISSMWIDYSHFIAYIKRYLIYYVVDPSTHCPTEETLPHQILKLTHSSTRLLNHGIMWVNIKITSRMLIAASEAAFHS